MKEHTAGVAQMMDEQQYWDIIAASVKNSNNQDEQEEFLTAKLEELSPAEIIGFKLQTYKLLSDIYTPEMWCAGHIMNQGLCSDDGFEYFRYWVVSRGKDTYYNAKSNPDSLVSESGDRLRFYDFEGFAYTAVDAFTEKTGLSIYDYISNSFPYFTGNHPEIQFNWNADEPETLKNICPKLFEAMRTLQEIKRKHLSTRRFLPPNDKSNGLGM